MIPQTEVTTTATHEFRIFPAERWGLPEGVTGWIVEYRPLNKKTGKPWQASQRVAIGADLEPKGWAGRPIAYSTIAAARSAMQQQIAIFIGRGRK